MRIDERNPKATGGDEEIQRQMHRPGLQTLLPNLHDTRRRSQLVHNVVPEERSGTAINPLGMTNPEHRAALLWNPHSQSFRYSIRTTRFRVVFPQPLHEQSSMHLVKKTRLCQNIRGFRTVSVLHFKKNISAYRSSQQAFLQGWFQAVHARQIQTPMNMRELEGATTRLVKTTPLGVKLRRLGVFRSHSETSHSPLSSLNGSYVYRTLRCRIHKAHERAAARHLRRSIRRPAARPASSSPR